MTNPRPHHARPTVLLVVAALFILTLPALAQNKKKAGKKPKGPKPSITAPGGVIAPTATLGVADTQVDFPAACAASDGTLWVAAIAYDGKADTVCIAPLTADGFGAPQVLAGPGSMHRPRLVAVEGNAVLCVWSELRNGQWDLMGRKVVDGKPQPGTVAIAAGAGNNIFPDMAVAKDGCIWVVWQSLHGGSGDILACQSTTGGTSWSPPIEVTTDAAGDWEPEVAVSARGEALVVYDSYGKGNYDVWLARLTAAGVAQRISVAATARHEARASVAVSADGGTAWVAYEDGVERWGKDLGSEWRKQGGGLNYDRHAYLARVDLLSGAVDRTPDLARVIPKLAGTGGKPNSGAVNLPEVVLDGNDNPWVFFRYYVLGGSSSWQVAMTRYDAAAGTWAQARTLGKSAYCQDRRVAALTEAGTLTVFWPSDNRARKQQEICEIKVARIGTGPALAAAQLQDVPPAPEPAIKPANSTPERPRSDRPAWTFGGADYTLYWGDLHRHTDFSNCRTPDDGCIVDHFRYAYDAGLLDFLATTDHTDAGKRYHSYEWWQTQKLADIFHNPGFFVSFYGYEREQRWPYGHRNVIFTERGGPIIYIKRDNLANSPWAPAEMPPEDGVRKGDLSPRQLWQLLTASKRRCLTLAHTPAGGMGTDWSVYEKIDTGLENVVEIYQGSRNSNEGVGAPQPRVATRSGPVGFGKHNAGVYQNALKQGHRLGVFASSDHRTTNISYGGVYVREFDREGIFKAIAARRTIAATDRIALEFSCNGHMMGEIFETDANPSLRVRVNGTAPIAIVTVIRNEISLWSAKPQNNGQVDVTFTDTDPAPGENRYYVRIEQSDGNMAWASPVWVTVRH